MWFYVENGNSAGPFTDEQIRTVAFNGTINEETLICKEGMPNWVRLGDLPEFNAAQPPAAPAMTIPNAETSATIPQAAPRTIQEAQAHLDASTVNPSPKQFCIECKQTYSIDFLFHSKGYWVCAACKPRFLQKVREGAFGREQRCLAGFSTRFHAGVLDYIVSCLIGGMLVGVLFAVFQNDSGPNQSIFALILVGLFLLVKMGYDVGFIAYRGATVGHYRWGLKVVMADGHDVSFLVALARSFANFITYFSFGFGYLIALWDSEKRCLADFICGTRVIYIRK